MFCKISQSVLSELKSGDKEALHAIYWHRCLNEDQLCSYIYGDPEYTLARIKRLVALGLLDIIEYENDCKCVFCLTVAGVQFVRDTSEIPLYTIHQRTGKRKYDEQAGTLRPAYGLLRHQTYLNTLSLELIRACSLDPLCYKDSKFASSFTYAQPDGVVELPEFDFFLEMDMGTERSEALKEKWNHYRMYLSSRDYYLRRNKRIIVLFALENVSSPSRRRVSVLSSMFHTGADLLGKSFDCYVGTSSELVSVARKLISGQNKATAQIVTVLNTHTTFKLYRPKALGTIYSGVYLHSSKKQFLMEDFTDGALSALKNIMHFPALQIGIQEKLGCKPSMLLVCTDENTIYSDLKALQSLGQPDIYYTTISRLCTKPFHEALFQFDPLGNRFHFSDLDLNSHRVVYEKTIRRRP